MHVREIKYLPTRIHPLLDSFRNYPLLYYWSCFNCFVQLQKTIPRLKHKKCHSHWFVISIFQTTIALCTLLVSSNLPSVMFAIIQSVTCHLPTEISKPSKIYVNSQAKSESSEIKSRSWETLCNCVEIINI